MEGAGPEILRANSLYHIYESNAEEGNVVALRGLSVSILEGEAVAVVGPSGSGKSTLLKCLGGLMKPSAGSVELAGTRMTRLTGPELVKLRQETVSFIFQDSNLLPHLNALDNVAQPLIHQGVLARPARRRAKELLDRLGMGDRSFGMPEELSGGEQQRVAISRALITNPKLILADEPTGALDPITSREVLDLFDNLHKESDVAFLLVTHNREVASFCERSLELREGRFIAQHGGDVDIGDLSDSRELIVDDSGTVTLPPDLLLQLGGPGRFDVPELKRDILHLERVEEDKVAVGASGKMELSPSCPACFHQYGDSDEQLCPDCGSSRPMVQA
ncbi:MAG: ABC transporter [Euryarchaeota archaeon]|nr:ABC transporter [Euryarchaeota archaeon]|tara:strand:+ start:59 stop:1057 length:999 start_codon:yes stop_codon:yes gene_type:complete